MARFVLEVFTKMKEVVEQYVALMQRVHPRKAKRVRDDPEQLTSLASSEPRHDATMVSSSATFPVSFVLPRFECLIY